MSALAIIRPDDWNLALFVHLLGALAMVGALALAASYLFAARRDGSLAALRVGFGALLYAALPSFIVMRVGAQWIADEEGLADSDVAWIGIGYLVSDMGALLLVAATVAAGLALRRASRAEAAGEGGRGAVIAAWLVTVLIVAYLVAVWAMTTKPG
jgi:hypothetical protein